MSTGKIDDFGGHISGAAKERWSDYVKRLNAIAEVDFAEKPLSKIWPAPNYEKMIDDGMAVEKVSLLKALRSELDPKPGGSRPSRLKTWCEMALEFRTLADGLITGRVDPQDVHEALKVSGKLHPLSIKAKALEKFGIGFNLKGLSVDLRRDTYLVGLSRYYADSRLNTAEEAIDALEEKRKRLDKNLEHVKSYRSSRKVNPYSLRYIGKSPNDPRAIWMISRKSASMSGHMVHLKEWGAGEVTREEARAFFNDEAKMAEIEKRWEAMKHYPTLRAETNEPRKGVDRRNGQDVSPEQFQQTFGFHGVQFGNYVEGPRRQADLNNAYDAFLDLADVLNVEPSALSLGGKLGLAFGARGKGGKNGAVAHYECLNTVINLTKTKGPGSLAHEWFHGFDNVVAREFASLDAMATGRGVGRVSRYPEAHRETVVALMKMIRDFGDKTGVQKRSDFCDQARSKPYFSTSTEVGARVFETWVRHQLLEGNIQNDFLANIWSEDDMVMEAKVFGFPQPRYPYPMRKEHDAMNEIMGEAFAEGGPVHRMLKSFENPECGIPAELRVSPEEATVALVEDVEVEDLSDAVRAPEIIAKNDAREAEQLVWDF